MLLHIFAICFACWLEVDALTKDRECQINITKDSQVLRRDVCCANYEEKYGKCIECLNGFTSNSGAACVKCPDTFYGQNCIDKCKCEKNEQCHNEYGCISTTTETKDTTETDGKYWLISVVICGIIVIAGAVIASTLFLILKSRRMGNAKHPLNELRNSSAAAGEGNIYDEIDETMMDVVHIPQSEDNQQNVENHERTNNNSSGSADTRAGRASDGYLNPYTPLAKEWQKHTHVYNYVYSIDADMETHGYLNPYEHLNEA